MPKSNNTQASKKQTRNGFLIIVRPEPAAALPSKGQDRSFASSAEKLSSKAYSYIEMSSDALRWQLDDFIQNVSKVVNGITVTAGEFSIDSLELSLEITGKGSIGLLGSGGEIGGTGGIKLTLKREAKH